MATRPPGLLLLVLFVAAYLIDAWVLHLFTGIDDRWSDTFLRLQSRRYQPDPNIVLLVADEHSIAVMTEEVDRWPWPRYVFGEVGQAIAAQKPAAIIYDMAFADPDRGHPTSDAAMSLALRGMKNVYLPFVRQHPAGDDQGVRLSALAPYVGLPADAGPDAKADILLPRALNRDVWRLGGINFLADADGVGRRYPLRIDARGWPLPSMAARVARDLGYRVPDQADIVLAWTARTRRTVPFIDFYDDVLRMAHGEAPLRPQDEFTGKIVLIGAAATGVSDVHPTPRTANDEGTDIMAVALDNLIHERWLMPLHPAVNVAIGVLLMSLVWIGYRAGLGTPAIALAMVAATGALQAVAYVAIDHRLLVHSSSSLWFAWGLFATLALRSFVLERNLRQRAIDQFSRFVNPVIVRQLIEQGGLPKNAAAREVTVLFCDIRNFTSIAENLPPDELVALLNRHFSLHVDVIFRHSGTLDKFIGDAMMAVWGSPVADSRHARRAVRCALDMQAALPAFRRTLPLELQSFDIGIGIHSGRAVVGLVGPEKRLEYTAIGDTVNVASRIEGLTKGLCRILVSEETKRLAGDVCSFVHRGNFVVKGRVGAIDVFEPQAENKVNESATIQAAIALLLAMSLCFVVPKDAAAQSGTEATASQGTQSPTKEPPKATTPKKNARLDKTAKPDAAVAKQAKPDGALKTDAGKTDAVKSGSAKVEGTGAGSSDGLDVPSARNRPATPATATTGTREFVPRKAPAKPTPAQPAKTSASDDSKPSGK